MVPLNVNDTITQFQNVTINRCISFRTKISIVKKMSNKVAVPPTKDALLKSYRKRLKDDIGSMVANFTEIIKLCQISKSEEETQVSRSTLCEEEAFEMQVRAANMVSTNTYNEITNFQKVKESSVKR